MRHSINKCCCGDKEKAGTNKKKKVKRGRKGIQRDRQTDRRGWGGERGRERGREGERERGREGERERGRGGERERGGGGGEKNEREKIKEGERREKRKKVKKRTKRKKGARPRQTGVHGGHLPLGCCCLARVAILSRPQYTPPRYRSLREWAHVV